MPLALEDRLREDREEKRERGGDLGSRLMVTLRLSSLAQAALPRSRVAWIEGRIPQEQTKAK